jgi:hypothetical protein
LRIFHKAVSIPRLLDEYRHAHYVGETAARTLEDRIDLAEHLAYLGVEIAGNILLVLVARSGLPCDPDDFSAVGHHARGKGTAQLKRRLFHVFGGLCRQDPKRQQATNSNAPHAIPLRDFSRDWEARITAE